MKLVAFRCGMAFAPTILQMEVGVTVQISFEAEFEPATTFISARRSEPTSVDFLYTPIDPASAAGGFSGAIAYLKDEAEPILWEFSPTLSFDILGYNLPGDTSYTVVLLRQDVDYLMEQVSNYNPDADPGNLIPYMTNQL